MMERKHQLIFGPGGNSDSFYAAGFKRTVEASAWHGLASWPLNIPLAGASACQKAPPPGDRGRRQEAGVAVSVHAPYYINLASDLPENHAR